MIHSAILKEKDRVQARLAAESLSIHDYLVRSHEAAQQVADEYGFQLKYVEIPSVAQHRCERFPIPRTTP